MSILARFKQNAEGNVAIMFGLACVPLILAAGMAVDYSRASSNRASIQAAIDSAAIAAAKAAPRASDEELTELATAFFHANFSGRPDVTIERINIVRDGRTIRASADGHMPTTLTQVAGFETMPVNASSAVAWNATKVEVALVLDNTGSMAGTKLAELKTAAKEFVNILSEASYGPGTVRIGLVPYAEQVRLEAPAFRTASWLRFDGVTPASWTGCINERDLTYNTHVRTDASNEAKYPAVNCADNNQRRIERLSHDYTSLRNSIDGMRASGYTNITIGTTWGQAVLGSTGPFGDGALESDDTVRKYIIVMTDGDNTKSRHYNGGKAVLPHNEEMDPDTRAACSSVKADGIQVFTIGLMVEARVDELMRGCATKPDMYHSVENAANLRSVFRGIAQEIAQLRLTH